MKQKSKAVVLIGLCILILACLGYFLLAMYYRNGFSLNTWINGVYCTGKTVEEVNSELLSRVKAPIVIVIDQNGKEYQLSLEDLNCRMDYYDALVTFKEKQNSLLWIDNITLHREHQLEPKLTCDREAFEKLPFIVEEQKKKLEYCLTWNQENGYQLYDGYSNRMDVEKACTAFLSKIEAGETTINLADLDCYYDAALSQSGKDLQKLWQKIDNFQKCDIVYDMGAEKIPLSPAVLSTFLKEENGIPIVDKDGSFVLNREAIEAYVASIAESYDTYGKEREFLSTKGDVITVKGGTYGTTLNQTAEVKYLCDTLLLDEVHTGKTQEHIPAYLREAFTRGKNDIGDTYIEIDMTDQKMYYYESGKLMLETDVVTGNSRRRMDTPEGVNFVYGKQKNRVLRGPGYASPVKFWMPVKGGIGIHDATWRSEFGGTIYQTNGSHGCINTPTDKMKELYDMVAIGTPVVMFY